MNYETLIDYADCIEDCAEQAGFEGVTFKQDFGPWKKFEEVKTLWFVLDRGIIEEQLDDGTVVKGCKFTLAPVPGSNYTGDNPPEVGASEDEKD